MGFSCAQTSGRGFLKKVARRKFEDHGRAHEFCDKLF